MLKQQLKIIKEKKKKTESNVKTENLVKKLIE